MERKPGALRNGAPFKHWILPKGLAAFKKQLSLHADADKRFVSVLLLIQHHGLEAVDKACLDIAQHGVTNLQAVIQCLSGDKQAPDKQRKMTHSNLLKTTTQNNWMTNFFEKFYIILIVTHTHNLSFGNI